MLNLWLKPGIPYDAQQPVDPTRSEAASRYQAWGVCSSTYALCFHVHAFRIECTVQEDIQSKPAAIPVHAHIHMRERTYEHVLKSMCVCKRTRLFTSILRTRARRYTHVRSQDLRSWDPCPQKRLHLHIRLSLQTLHALYICI